MIVGLRVLLLVALLVGLLVGFWPVLAGSPGLARAAGAPPIETAGFSAHHRMMIRDYAAGARDAQSGGADPVDDRLAMMICKLHCIGPVAMAQPAGAAVGPGQQPATRVFVLELPPPSSRAPHPPRRPPKVSA